MAYADFQYEADSSVIYKIGIPSDFALAMGSSYATGSEPQLDDSISPRYINYVAASGVRRTAIVTDPGSLGTLPATLTVDGVLYTAGLRQGESIPAYQSPLLLGAALLQGPPGPAFAFYYVTDYLSSDTAISNTGNTNIVGRASLPDGTYIVVGRVTLFSTGGCVVTGQIVNGGSGGDDVALGTIAMSGSSWATMDISALVALTRGASNDTYVALHANAAVVSAKIADAIPSGLIASMVTWIKIA